MNQGAKQRIVGTVVLLALALIFLPIVFDGQGSYEVSVSSRIPEAPVISILPEPTQSRPVIAGGAIGGDPSAATTVSVGADPVDAVEDEAASVEVAAATPATETAAPAVEITESQPIFSRAVPELNEAGLPQGWVVRLGSFSDRDNANTLVARLQNAGYKAYLRSLPSNQGALTGVFVGPWLDRALVNEYQRKLQEEFSLAGMVVRYELERL